MWNHIKKFLKQGLKSLDQPTTKNLEIESLYKEVAAPMHQILEKKPISKEEPQNFVDCSQPVIKQLKIKLKK